MCNLIDSSATSATTPLRSRLSGRTFLFCTAVLCAALLTAACSADKTRTEFSDSNPASAPDAETDRTLGADLLTFSNDMSIFDQLQLARTRWAAQGPTNYDLVVERLCDDPCFSTKRRNTILDGALMASTDLLGDGYGDAETMLDLFEDIENRAANQEIATIEWNQSTGALQTVQLDFGSDRPVNTITTVVTVEEATAIAETEHGFASATQQCPNIDWTLISASAFTVSIPSDLVEQTIEGVDSEVAEFIGDDFTVAWDYGPYSNRLDFWEGPFTAEVVNYSGLGGRIVVAEPIATGWPQQHLTAIHFGRVYEYSQNSWDGLTLTVLYADPAMAATARCIVGSIEWSAG